MKTRLLIGAAVIVAAVPAVIGLWGNGSFSQDVPVRIPASGQIVPLAPAPAASPSTAVDDHGGDTPRDQRTEPGDDRDVQGGVTTPGGATEPGDDNGGAPEPGDDHGGSSHGGDDSGADDHGGSGHGSDD